MTSQSKVKRRGDDHRGLQPFQPATAVRAGHCSEQAERSPPWVSPQTGRRWPATWCFFTILACFSFFASEARAQLGAPPPKHPDLVVRLAGGPGRLFEAVVSRPKTIFRLCAVVAPVCVHGERRDLEEVLGVLSSIFLRLEVLGFPAPLSDGAQGGDGRFDLYVTNGIHPAAEREELDFVSGRDATPAFGLVPPGLRGCALRAATTQVLVQASLLSLDVAENAVIAEGFARYVAGLTEPCEDLSLMIADLPAETAVTSNALRVQHLVQVLENQRGLGYGALVPALFSMSAQRRGVEVPFVETATEISDELGAAHFHDEPSVFDILTTTLAEYSTTFDALLLDVAVDRLNSGSSPPVKSGDRDVSLSKLWSWRVPNSSLPRNLAVRARVEPTGASFVRVDLDRTPKNDTIEFDVSWDQGGRFSFRVVKIDSSGKPMASLVTPMLERARKQFIEVRHLAGVAAVVLVAVNGGDVRYPFHPAAPLGPGAAYEVVITEGE